MALGLVREVDDDEQRAETILAAAIKAPSTFPDALLDILTTIIKPLFSSSKHPQLTETGRKRLVPTPSIPGTFSHDSVFDNSRPWKNGWTTDLLLKMLSKYYYLIPESSRKKTIEAHFHLLIPPILNLMDDSDLNYKANGCDCLSSLCSLLTSTQSNMMTRTGLSDVFIDTLKNNFIYLPPLTPETESLHLLQSLYPAFFALIAATTTNLQSYIDNNDPPSLKTQSTTRNPSLTTKQTTHEESHRQTNLALLLRHSLLYSLTSLSSFSDHNTTTSTPISTYLLSQLPILVSQMGTAATPQHVQVLLPLLRRIMSDPFATAAPEMLIASIQAMGRIVTVCGERIVERWWAECLRGCVGCWLNLEDEIELGVKDAERRGELEKVRVELRRVVMLLRVGGNEVEFDKGREQMVKEETGLDGLFDPAE